MAEPEPHLFVSYASADRERVLPIVAVLEGAGVRVWLDQIGIPGGTSYGTEIVAAIRKCAAVLLCCSAAAYASRNVRQEIALAWRVGRTILPLRLEPVEVHDVLAYWLETAQWVDLFDRPAGAWLPDVLRGLAHGAAATEHEGLGIAGRSPDAAAVSLPEAPTALLGRERELVELGRRLTSGTRLLTLTGPGGVGKTRLALAVARSVAASFPDGVAFADLAPVTDAALVLATIAEALSVRESAERTLAENLRDYLRTRRLLLVLDNVEQVVEAATEVAGLVAVAPGVTILATSRVPLGVRAEQEVPLGTLTLPAPGASIAEVQASPAVSLLVERARATGADLTLTETNAAVLSDIVRRLDGLPLAIELAATRVRLFPPEALLARLEHRLPLLTGGARDLPERQQTLTRAIGWSHDLLRSTEQTLFRRLAVFAGGATFDAIEQVAAVDQEIDPYHGLTELLRHNLLRQERTEGEPRFSMLETIREYAADQLAASEEADRIRERHARFFLALSGGVKPPRRVSDRFGPWLAAVETEHDNLRAALAWGVGRPGDATALQIACNLASLWLLRGHYSEGRRWLERIVDTGVPASPTLLASAHATAAMLARMQGDQRASRGYAERAVELARQGADQEMIANALYGLGGVCQVMGDTERAVVVLEEALAVARGGENAEALVGAILNVLGDVTYALGDRDRAVQLVEEGLALKRAIGDPHGAAVCLTMLGSIASTEEDYPRAAAQFAEALELFRRVGARAGVADTLFNLGMVAGEQGDVTRALALVREALAAFLELGDRSGFAFALENFAHQAERRGDPELATVWLSASAAIRAATGEPLPVEQRGHQEAFETKLRDRLGPEVFAAQWATGHARPEAAVIAEAMDWSSQLVASTERT